VRFPQLHERFASLVPLPAGEWEKAEALAREQVLAKREFFLQPGEPADRFGVVLQGVFRAVRVSARGGESIKAFRAEGELIGAYAEMLQRVPSMTAIEALEPSRVLVFQARDFRELEQGHVCWERLARRVAEHHFIIKERREQEFLDLSAEERLVRFWEEHPHLTGRVPQRDVAAYLGITEVTLSRIMSRRRKREG